MARIERLTVQGFRSFGKEPQHLDIDGALAIVWGPNSEGKTSLAEAFDLDASERVVVRMLLRGQGAPRIAARLNSSPAMAAWRIQDVFAKTGAESPRALLRMAQAQLRTREPADVPTREIPRWANVNDGM